MQDSSSDNYLNKNIFKDKKLNKLWLKAEKAGFTSKFRLLLLVDIKNELFFKQAYLLIINRS